MGYWDKKEPKAQEQEEEQEDSLEALEGDCLKEMDEVSKGFRERMKAENDRFRDMCDTEYWFCVCFTSRAQKEELLRALRERDRETRVLILSARSRISDKVEGLDCGANDYLVKPFHLEELEARVRSLTRRSFVQHDAVLRCGELSFDTVKRTAQAKGENVALTRKENGILEYLLLNQGRPVSQEELMEHVWDGSVDSFSNSIRVHISSLRKKLKAALGYDPILNRIGEGYLMGGREP